MKHAPCHRVTAPKELYRHVKLLCSCNCHTPNFEQKSVNKAFLDFSSMSVTTIASDSEKNHFWWKQETWPSLVETKIAALYIYIPGVSRNVSQTFKLIVTVSVVADIPRWLETSIIRASTNFIFPNSPTFPGFHDDSEHIPWLASLLGKLTDCVLEMSPRVVKRQRTCINWVPNWGCLLLHCKWVSLTQPGKPLLIVLMAKPECLKVEPRSWLRQTRTNLLEWVTSSLGIEIFCVIYFCF